MRLSHPGLPALSAFFAFGAAASGISAVTLLSPGTPLDIVWRLNPRGHVGLLKLGGVGGVLMSAVCVACALAARGLWIRASWGHRLALTLLGLNLVGDALTAWVLGDRRTLIGIPIGGLLIAFLLSSEVRACFRPSQAAV